MRRIEYEDTIFQFHHTSTICKHNWESL